MFTRDGDDDDDGDAGADDDECLGLTKNGPYHQFVTASDDEFRGASAAAAASFARNGALFYQRSCALRADK